MKRYLGQLPVALSVAWLAVALTLPGSTPTALHLAQVPAPVATSVAKVAVSPDPLVIMTLGDSITLGGNWQAELCRLMLQDAGVTCDIRNVSVNGSSCTYWPSRINGLLNTHHPHVVTFFCGTNDNGTNATALANMGDAFRMTVESTYLFQNSPRIAILPAWIQYSDVLTLPGPVRYLIQSEPNVNDELYRNMQYYAPAGWFPGGIADFQQIPGTGEFMDQNCPGCAGIHPNAKGYKAMGRIVYDRFAVMYGWPASSEPPLCNMYGHRLSYSPPATYVHC